MMDQAAARRFLATAYEEDDWIAVLVKSCQTGRVAQRVVPVSLAMSSTFLTWLAGEQAAGLNVFVSVNALRQTATRRRADVAALRHVFLDADQDGPPVLTTIAARRDLPPRSYVLHSSTGRVHVLWRVAGFGIDQAEALQKQLALEFGTDATATSAAQMTRLVGSWNHKYAPPTLVTIEYRDPDRAYAPDDFPSVRPLKRQDPPHRSMVGSGSVLSRARRYAAALPPAIARSHGDVRTFRVCCRLVRGFALSDAEALDVLREWNRRCEPPWSEPELLAKLRHARRYRHEPIGGLLETRP